jgi:hypothetical protein
MLVEEFAQELAERNKALEPIIVPAEWNKGLREFYNKVQTSREAAGRNE